MYTRQADVDNVHADPCQEQDGSSQKQQETQEVRLVVKAGCPREAALDGALRDETMLCAQKAWGGSKAIAWHMLLFGYGYFLKFAFN